MQNKPQPDRRSIWPVFAALLLIVIAGIAVWRFWPREYSPADPRGYGALEDIPLEELFASNSGWDYKKLLAYGIQSTGVYRTEIDGLTLREHNRELSLDFLQRVLSNQPAIARTIYGESYTLCELRYQPADSGMGSFVVTCDFRRRQDSAEKEIVQYRVDHLTWFGGGGKNYSFGADPYSLEDPVGCSVGFSIFPSANCSEEELEALFRQLERMDLALYRQP